jgi:hypothetical protein
MPSVVAGAGPAQSLMRVRNDRWSVVVRRVRNRSKAKKRRSMVGLGGVVGMRRAVNPGEGSLAGLRWLARVGPAPLSAWGVAMGWSAPTARSHVVRLIRAGYIDRTTTTHGGESLQFATRRGVKMTELTTAHVALAPAPTTWAHHAACAWTAAWLTARGRTMIGSRELLTSAEWLAEVQWIERHGVRRRGHRPDLVGGVGLGGPLLPIEVELAAKSTQRLRAILGLHAAWITAGKARAVIYICATGQVADRVAHEARGVGLSSEHTTLRIELLETIRTAAITARRGEQADVSEGGVPAAGRVRC